MLKPGLGILSGLVLPHHFDTASSPQLPLWLMLCRVPCWAICGPTAMNEIGQMNRLLSCPKNLTTTPSLNQWHHEVSYRKASAGET
jgi:hypothetical protein